MPTKLLMTIAAAWLAVCGGALLFLPDGVSRLLLGRAGDAFFAQQFGAALLGFAMLNWVARASALGGIYGRAVVVGNEVFFTASGLVLLSRLLDGPASWALWVCLLAAAALALGFARLLLGGGPRKPTTSDQ